MSDLTSLTQLSAAWLLTYALHSTLFLGLAWLVSRRLAKRMPRVEEAVWRFALVAALATASLQLAAGFRPLAGSWGLTVPAVSEASEAAAPAPLDLTSMVSQASSPRVAVPDRALRAPSPLRIPAGTAPAGPVTSKLPVSVPVLFIGLWVLGALLLSARWVAGHLLLRRRLRPRPEVVGGNMFSQFTSLLGEADLDGPVRLTCSSRLSVPIALGLSRREVCVPPKALAALTPEEQEGMLAHELAHLVRRDPFWLAFSRILASVFFFQPLNWVAYRRMREISELLCDEWAIDRTGRPLSLARCLAEVAGWSFHPVEAQAAPGMADRPSHLAHRIRRLLDGGRTPERRVHPVWLIASMIILLVAVAAAAPGVYAASAARADAAQEAKAQADAQRTTEQDPIDDAEIEGIEEGVEEGIEDGLEDGAKEGIADAVADALDELDGLDELDVEEMARIEADVAAQLGDLGELSDLGELADLGDLAAFSDAMAQGMSGLSEEEARELAERYGKMAEEMSKRIESQISPQMEQLQRHLEAEMEKFQESPEMKKLIAQAEEIAERAHPSDEEMERLHAQAEKFRKDAELSAEERKQLREEARQMAEKYRMSEEDRAEMRKLSEQMRELSRQFNEEHRAEMEKMRREILQQTQAIREEMRRQMESDPQMRELRERHRRDADKHREEVRKQMDQHREEIQRRHEADRDRIRQRTDQQREEQKQQRERMRKEREQRREELRKKDEQDQGAFLVVPDAWIVRPGMGFAFDKEYEAQIEKAFALAQTIDYKNLVEQALAAK